MPEVRLSGQLVCASVEEAVVVRRHLPFHVSLTLAEPGCVSFEVNQTDDPLVFQVEERFRSAEALAVHQRRVAVSEWGRVTIGIERRYVIEGIR